MAQIIWMESSLSDLDAIAEYVALDRSSATISLVKNIFLSIDQLEQFPALGGKPPEFKKSRYLEIIVNPCRIFYRIESDKIYILYIMRSERKLRKYLLDTRRNS